MQGDAASCQSEKGRQNIQPLLLLKTAMLMGSRSAAVNRISQLQIQPRLIEQVSARAFGRGP